MFATKGGAHKGCEHIITKYFCSHARRCLINNPKRDAIQDYYIEKAPDNELVTTKILLTMCGIRLARSEGNATFQLAPISYVSQIRQENKKINI